MPIISSTYRAPYLFRQTDFATIYSAKFRKVHHEHHKRERFELSDGDFLDLDWSFSEQPSEVCILLLHGLEGDSNRAYIRGTAKLFIQNKIDVCAMNFRSCSGEMNRVYGCYHSGQTNDLAEVLKFIEQKNYKSIILKGVSLGGNVVLKFLGENSNFSPSLKAGIAVSVPCDLAGSSKKIISKRNWLYGKNFHRQLIKKSKTKQKFFPEKISSEMIHSIKNLWDFDEMYTAKAHGFQNAMDYYQQSSSLQVLNKIEVPTLILNAKNDSFLSEASYPYKMAENNPNLYLETPKYGGHVGFWQPSNIYYNEQRALEFAQRFL